MNIPAETLATQNDVANEVRAHLARRRLSARQAAFRLGWTQAYISRRMTGDAPFDVADLDQLARLLDVDMSDFLPPRRRSDAGGIMRPRVSLLSRYGALAS